ncbi:DUF5989 family protein [Rhodopirellula bahusiensis]|uniref:Uncharacterized protein n=1 Tax=Rhodopirellula bahusiensis TaxID=2014065 RepID=A0A2G1W470_9BACT|nr:DUF5989 family protein [Rhodopirellula bahusiensis]PHQ33791.1 hypothetical protein CEE69_17810 [Rhodopirellula bahusiensis]
MSDPKTPSEPTPPSDFERESEQQDIGLLREFVLFLRENKKWWMIPLIGSLLLVGLLSIMASSGAAPFIYTLF